MSNPEVILQTSIEKGVGKVEKTIEEKGGSFIGNKTRSQAIYGCR